MAGVELDEASLAKRPSRLRTILRSLTGNRQVACDGFLDQVDRARVIAAHEGSTAQTRYRDWYFRTTAGDIECQYFEIWKPRSELVWFMDRAYLHLYEVDRAERKHVEVLCVHADPVDAAEFKKGPHVHVSNAPYPIYKCHFPLNLGHLTEILSSCDHLTKALESAFRIVREEVLSRYRNAPNTHSRN